MKVSKGQSQPEIVAAAFLILYMLLGRPFEYRVLIAAQVNHLQGDQVSFGKGRGSGFPAPRNFDTVFRELGKNCA